MQVEDIEGYKLADKEAKLAAAGTMSDASAPPKALENPQTQQIRSKSGAEEKDQGRMDSQVAQIATCT